MRTPVLTGKLKSLAESISGYCGTRYRGGWMQAWRYYRKHPRQPEPESP